MRAAFDAVALAVGYAVITACALLLLAGAVVSVWAVVFPRKRTVAHLSGERSPHILRHPVLHVEAQSPSEAWRAIAKGAA